MTHIAFLGLGAMGSRVATNLIKAGHTLSVYNRTHAASQALAALGARVATTPRDAVNNADYVISMLRDDDAARAVWLEGEDAAIHGVKPGALLMESSTVTPPWTATLSQAAKAAKARFVEAPVLGTRPQAEAGQLIYLIAGDATEVEDAKAVLAAAGAAFHHTGAIGTASAMKLAINAQYGVQVAIWAETLSLLETQGIAIADAVAIINSLPTTSPAMQIAGKLMSTASYAPLFPIDLVEKDFRYAQGLAQASGLTLGVLHAAHALYTRAKTQGYAADNIVGVKKAIA
jgi:3-hydroxyisobutyrate dehydrogenase